MQNYFCENAWSITAPIAKVRVAVTKARVTASWSFIGCVGFEIKFREVRLRSPIYGRTLRKVSEYYAFLLPERMSLACILGLLPRGNLLRMVARAGFEPAFPGL